MNGLSAASAALALICVGLWLFTAGRSRRIETRYPVIGALVPIEGGLIHVVERAAQGPERGVVVLVHGASGNHADMLVALGGRLAAQGFRTLSVDRPGHGWSQRILGRAASSPERQARMLRAAFARLGVAHATLVVHSWAGVLGLAMALDAPDFVRALVLISPVSHPWPGGVKWYYTLASWPWLGALFRQLVVLPAGLANLASGVRSVFEPCAVPPNFIEITRVPLVLRPAHFRANAEDVADVKSYVIALSPRYHAIRAPTTIVSGDSDGVVYAEIHAAGCARDIPGATLTTLKGVGHSPHHCAPDRVVEAILEVERRAALSCTP